MATEKIESINAEIEKTKTEIRQLENRAKRLTGAHSQLERNARTRRLCQRMGLFESMLPDTVTLTDEQFKSFLEKTVTTEHSRRILNGLTVQGNASAAPKPTVTAQGNATDESENESNARGATG